MNNRPLIFLGFRVFNSFLLPNEEDMRTYPEKPQKIYYFGTCLVDMFYPGAGMVGIKLLQQNGVKVIFPSQQTCCGQHLVEFIWERINGDM